MLGAAWRRVCGRCYSGDASVRRCLLPRSGSAVSVLGRAEQCLEIVARSRVSSTLGIVIAGSDSTLRQILESRELRASNVVGCVEPGAFVSEDSALIVSANCGEGVEAFTFDSKSGALPDLGRSRLAEALERPPHFLVFAGRHLLDHEEDDEAGSVLSSFARRVQGLFGSSSCSGALVKGSSDANNRGRLVHARKRSANRAGRLRVYRAEGAAVGVALLAKRDDSDVAEIAKILSSLCFGSDGKEAPLKRLWGAGDATMGSDQQQVLHVLMRFYEACDKKDIHTIRSLLDDDHGGPTLALPGRNMVEGVDDVVRSYERFFARHALIIEQGVGTGSALAIDIVDLRVRVSTNVAYTTCTQRYGPDEEENTLQVTNVFRKVRDDWKLAHQHASIDFHKRDHHFDDEDDDDDL